MCGMKAAGERGLTATRLVEARKRAGFTNQKLAAAHVREQTGVIGLTDSQWASYESGDPRRPFQQKHRDAIESVFGPLGDDAEPPTNTAPEMFDLLAAMAQQTTVVTALIEELRAERQERASMADTVNDLKEQIQALAAGLAEALRAGGGEGGPPTTPTQGGPGARQPDDKKPRSHSPVTDR
jgi:hypothetical protein